MKKWRVWLPILILVLAIASGSFAYTYLTATQQIAVTGTGDIASVTPDGSPSWSDIFGRQAGDLPTTSLFKIVPKTEYTGDLLVSLYLTNTGDLVEVFQHLNMKVEILDAGGTPVGRTEYLTLKNGVVTFELSYGAGWSGEYKVKITGGSYNTLGGGAGGTNPAFYCEATQT